MNQISRLKELADVFGGEQKLSRIQPNKKLQSWLQQRGGLFLDLHTAKTSNINILEIQGASRPSF